MIAEIVTAVSVAVTCTTALLVGYWHRKQLRQLELYRLDPSVGMVPPPSFLFVFFKINFDLLGGILFPTVGIWSLVSEGKVTALTILLISANIGTIVLTLVGRAFRQHFKQTLAVTRDFLEIHTTQQHLFEDIINRMKALEDRLDAIDATVV